ncbi:MAG: DUF3473 domain-containing protein [Roseivirga sp.]
MMNILTFDVEDWFHILDNDSTKTPAEWAKFESRVERNVDNLLELLDEKNQKATCFCLAWIGEKYPNLIKKIHDQGHEIGSHTYLHQLIFEQQQNEFKSDFLSSVHLLEDITGAKVKSFRAPGFSLTPEVLWVFEVLAEAGIEYDCSIFPGKRAHGGMPNFHYSEPVSINVQGSIIKEFPMSCKNMLNRNLVFSGGGYFRLFPYWLIRNLSNSSEYVMTYFHPRDFDADQPMISDLTLVRKFKSYYGLGGALNKLSKYLDDFDFQSLNEASDSTDWTKTPVLNYKDLGK